jgi:DNA repair exonuclease SbcCD ATPase subunit
MKLPEGTDEEFPEGLILISGKNSYGKSTILQGILMAFFGPKIFTGRSGASFITYGQNKAEIYVYFAMDNTNYYILRKWGKTGSATSKLFEFDKKSKKFLERKKFNIEKFFEISKDQALSTVFVRQGEVEELANIKGAKLRDMIIDLFRLDIIDDSLKYLDGKAKSLNIEKENLKRSRVPIERIESNIQDFEQQNDGFKEIISKREGLKTRIESKLNSYPSEELISKLEDLYRKNEITEEKYNSHKANFEKKIKLTKLNSENFSSQEEINSRIDTLSNKNKELTKSLNANEKKKLATIKGMGITKGRIEDIEAKIGKMEKGKRLLEQTGEKKKIRCPTCQSILTEEHYESVINEFKEEILKNQPKLVSITSLIKKLEQKINILKDELDDIKNEIPIIKNLRQDFEQFQEYKSELMKYQKEIDLILAENIDKIKDVSSKGIRNLSIELIKNMKSLEAINEELDQKQKMIENNSSKIEKLHKEIKKMKNLEKKIANIEVDIEHINKAKEYVRRFVTEYMVAKRLVKNIALKAEKYIKNFTSGQYGELLLEESGSKKTGLILKIKDHFNGEYEQVEVLSGGDRTALGMALRLAISELMSVIRPTKDSPKRNPKVDFLLLDEPLAALDESRRERILLHLTMSKVFSQIFLITHTAIPPDIQMHTILVDKDHSTGISTARFEKVQAIKLF